MPTSRRLVAWALKLNRPEAKKLETAIKERKAQYELTPEQLQRAKDSSAFPIRLAKRPKA